MRGPLARASGGGLRFSLWGLLGLALSLAGIHAGCAHHGAGGAQVPKAGSGGVGGEPLGAGVEESVMALGPGDVFDVHVFQDAELSGSFMVGQNGKIHFPLVGAIQVAGLTPNAAADAIRTRLQDGYIRDPVINVFVKQRNSKKVFVFGKVRKPGTFNFESGMTVVQAITLAGGLAESAATDRTRITRREEGRERRYTVAISAILDGHAPNFALRPGDIVFVPESMF